MIGYYEININLINFLSISVKKIMVYLYDNLILHLLMKQEHVLICLLAQNLWSQNHLSSLELAGKRDSLFFKLCYELNYLYITYILI